MTPSPGMRSPPSDSFKESILRESTAGWSNAISPLRIAKRDSGSGISSSEEQTPQKGVARRSSNSYKHVWSNNLVSKSPFKSQIPTASRQSARGSNSPRVAPSPRSVRKTSGEKRPRPESLINQAESENAERGKELGFKRRQSKGFQGLVDKEPVTKSPFKRIVSPTPVSAAAGPFSITLPHSSSIVTDDDVTSLESADNSDSVKDKDQHDIFSSPAARSPSPVRPLTPQSRLPTPNPGRDSPLRVSPLPSAMQVSPARSSLVSKRLMGPRSLSNSPVDTPTRRERRKTVTFDERCDVVEFDRASHEDANFETDDEDVYGPPEPVSLIEQNSKDSFSNSSSDSIISDTLTPTHSPDHSGNSVPEFGIGDDSISGLVDSMIQEAEASSAHLEEPATPPTHSTNLDFMHDLDLMVGGDESGVPHGRIHHAERQHNQDTHEHERQTTLDISTEIGDEPSFSSISLSTPPHHHHPLPPPDERSQLSRSPVALAPDTERDENGMPLGRTHRAERIRQARREEASAGLEDDVLMLPPSPSPARRTSSKRREGLEGMVPRFDVGINLDMKPAKNDLFDDPFGLPAGGNEQFNLELDFDRSILSNTSIASFHEFLPGSDYGVANEHAGDKAKEIAHTENSVKEPIEHADEVEGPLEDPTTLSIGQSDVSLGHVHLPNSKASEMLLDGPLLDPPPTIASPGLSEMEIGRDNVHSNVSPAPSVTMPNSTPSSIKAHSAPLENDRNVSSIETPPVSSMPSNMRHSTSASSLSRVASMSSGGSLSRRSPKISKEEVMRRLVEQRSGSASPSPSPSHAPAQAQEPGNVPIGIGGGKRPPLEERLKRALSPPPLTSLLSQSLAHQQTPAQVVVQSLAQPSPRPIDPAHASTYGGGQPSLFDFGQPGVDIGDMRSALDRLVDNVNTGRGKIVEESGDMDTSMAETEGDSGEMCVDISVSADNEDVKKGKAIERASTAPSFYLPQTFIPTSNDVSRTPSHSSVAPPVPPKDGPGNAIKLREQLIKEKRREARARDEGAFISPRRDSAGRLAIDPGSPGSKTGRKGLGRPSGRRSLSTGDADDLLSPQPGAQRRVSALKNQLGGVLGIPFEDAEDRLGDSIEQELKKLGRPKDKSYSLREHEGTIYASSSAEDTISHMKSVGDLDSGKAWRPVRRPSDMNEYSRQIKEFRSQEKPGKAYGKVFVKVLGVKGLNIPMPEQSTSFSCTLNNGIHFVTTPESQLARDSRIEQEFELIEHGKLEFTLTLKIRRDPHIIAQFKALTAAQPLPPQPPRPAPTPSTKGGGMRGFFGSSPKKSKVVSRPETPSVPVIRPIEENLARYMKPDGTLARAFISFKEIASRCDTRLFETSYQLIGQRLEGNGTSMAPQQVGEIVLQVFRLPPLPGIPQNELPQSLEECHRGLRHINWHKVTYHEGTLTQLGGDCTTWRRRQLRVIGANLVAFNDVTKRATATIDLKKAIAVEDDQCPRDDMSPASHKTSRSRLDIDDFDSMYGVERSFRLQFPKKQEIAFFADSDEEKAKWLEVLRALVGRIPPNPLWAELIWQRQDELARATALSRSNAASKSKVAPRPEAKEPIRWQR